MKHFIWMLCGIFISGLLLGSLTACGADQFDTSVVVTNPSSTGGTVSTPDKANTAPDEIPEDPAEENTALDTIGTSSANPDGKLTWNMAYAQVLKDALLKGVLPDGENLDWINAEAASENQFAVCDLDGDGEEELLLRWTNASTAGTAEFVFRYDGQGIGEEFQEFAGVQFYPSGAAKADWSHNQGWAGRVCPFNLYQYDSGTGVYQEVGAVDAWDSSLFEDDEVLSAAFPKDADQDGDGVVYYILTGEWYTNNRTPSDGNLDGKLWGAEPVDGPDVDNWVNAYTGGAYPIQLPLKKLTLENISLALENV